MSPNNVDLDATQTNTFSCTIQGNILKAYKLLIYNNSDNTLLYDPSIVDISSTPIYNSSALSISVPNTSGMTNSSTSNYKWVVRLYENYPASTPTYTSSMEVYFQARTTCTVAINNMPASNIVLAKNFTFEATYTSAESIPVKYHLFELFDSNGTLIDSSETQYSSDLSWEYDGFVDGESYSLTLTVVNQNGSSISTTEEFTVNYDSPSLIIKPDVEIDYDTDSVDVSWASAVSIPGKTIGVSPTSYLSSTPTTGLTSLGINSGKTVYWDESNSADLSIPTASTLFYQVQLPSGFTGDFIKLENTDTSNSYVVSYDGSKFTYASATPTITGEYEETNATGDNIWWVIVLLPSEVQFYKVVNDITSDFSEGTPTNIQVSSNTISIADTSEAVDQQQTNYGFTVYVLYSPGQTFTTGANTTGISKISFYKYFHWIDSKIATATLYNSPAKDTILGSASVTGPISDHTWVDFIFSSPIEVLPNTQYYLEFTSTGDGLIGIGYNNGGYNGGNYYEEGVSYPSLDLTFKVYRTSLWAFWTSPVYDLEFTPIESIFTFTTTEPANTDVITYIKSSDDNIAWSDWQVFSTSGSSLPLKRYIQIKYELSTTDVATSPSVDTSEIICKR